MLKVLGAITATAIALGASTAFAGSTKAESSFNAVQAEWAKLRAQRRDGDPRAAIPVAPADAVNSAFTGNDSPGPIVQGQDLKAKSN